MTKHNIEQIIRGLRIRSTPHKNEEHLEQVLTAHDRWHQVRRNRHQSQRLTHAWTAIFAIAATIISILCLAVPSNSPTSMNSTQEQTMAVPPVGIVTVDSLQRAFCQGGLEELERQLDQSFKLRGPCPVDLTTQGLF